MTLNVDQHFVDRDPERALFAKMLSGELKKRVLRVLVPPGHGKSWLVTRLLLDCEERGVPTVRLDFDARRHARPVDARYVIERFLELLGEARLPQVNARMAEWRQASPSPEVDARHLPAIGRALRHDLSRWTNAPAAMGDEFTRYETGIAALLARLGKAHPHYLEAVNYQTRLLHENIAPKRFYGDTDARKAERNEIVMQINRLTMEVLGIPFDDLCATPTAAAIPPPPIAILLDTFEQIPDTVQEWLSGWLFDGLRRDLAHIRVVVAGRPEPACCAFFDQADLWGSLVANIPQFAPMNDDDILEYYRRRDCTFGHLDSDTICHLARANAGMMAQVGDNLPQEGGD